MIAPCRGKHTTVCAAPARDRARGGVQSERASSEELNAAREAAKASMESTGMPHPMERSTVHMWDAVGLITPMAASLMRYRLVISLAACPVQTHFVRIHRALGMGGQIWE